MICCGKCTTYHHPCHWHPSCQGLPHCNSYTPGGKSLWNSCPTHLAQQLHCFPTAYIMLCFTTRYAVLTQTNQAKLQQPKFWNMQLPRKFLFYKVRFTLKLFCCLVFTPEDMTHCQINPITAYFPDPGLSWVDGAPSFIVRYANLYYSYLQWYVSHSVVRAYDYIFRLQVLWQSCTCNIICVLTIVDFTHTSTDVQICPEI